MLVCYILVNADVYLLISYDSLGISAQILTFGIFWERWTLWNEVREYCVF
jgi:hypothetical protein